MKRLYLALLVTAPFAAHADPAKLPQRQAGLWEMTTSMDEGKGAVEQKLTMCVDEEMERNTVQASLLEHQSSCARYDISRAGEATLVVAECTFSKRKVTSRTEMSGDFKTAFQVEIDSTTSQDGETAQTISVKRKIKQSGRYLGTSCNDLKPGEAQAPDGTKVMVQ